MTYFNLGISLLTLIHHLGMFLFFGFPHPIPPLRTPSKVRPTTLPSSNSVPIMYSGPPLSPSQGPYKSFGFRLSINDVTQEIGGGLRLEILQTENKTLD